MQNRWSGSCFVKQRRCAEPAFMQHISEQKSNRIVLKTGWMRDEGVCSQSGPGERRHQACPRNSHSPQGTVAQFYKEPKMIRPVAKLFFPQPLPVQRLHCKEHMFLYIQHLWDGPSSFCVSLEAAAWSMAGVEERHFSWELWRNLSLICGLTDSIRPSWQLDHRGRLLMAH